MSSLQRPLSFRLERQQPALGTESGLSSPLGGRGDGSQIRANRAWGRLSEEAIVFLPPLARATTHRTRVFSHAGQRSAKHLQVLLPLGGYGQYAPNQRPLKYWGAAASSTSISFEQWNCSFDEQPCTEKDHRCRGRYRRLSPSCRTGSWGAARAAPICWGSHGEGTRQLLELQRGKPEASAGTGGGRRPKHCA